MKPFKSSLLFRQPGFSLIELMIIVAIIGILAAVAMPSYRQYIIRGNRAAAESQMMDIASREQQFFLANRQYADKTALESNGYTLTSDLAGIYTYAVDVNNAATPPTFTITFSATGYQSSDGNLGLTSSGVKTPANKW